MPVSRPITAADATRPASMPRRAVDASPRRGWRSGGVEVETIHGALTTESNRGETTRGSVANERAHLIGGRVRLSQDPTAIREGCSSPLYHYARHRADSRRSA